MSNPVQPLLPPAMLEAVADYFKVLSETNRLQILQCLRQGPMNVMELCEATGLGQANLSKHLKAMTQAGILSRQPKGTSAYYQIVDPLVFQFCDLVCSQIQDRLRQQAETFKQLNSLPLNSNGLQITAMPEAKMPKPNR